MKTILLLISICLNAYLFYRFIKERNERIAVTAACNTLERQYTRAKEQVSTMNDDICYLIERNKTTRIYTANTLSCLIKRNSEIRTKVEHLIKRKEDYHA